MTWEYAAATGDRQLANSILRAPSHIRARINAGRQARGMEPVLTAAEIAATIPVAMAAARTVEAAGPSGPGVWLDNGGKLVPVTSRTRLPWPRATSTSRPATRHGGRGPLLMARVLVVPCGGIAPASRIRGQYLDEVVSPIAFGTAEQLNARGGYDLRNGHEGPRFATAGERLRFVDGGSIGPVLAWEPNLAMPWDAEAVRLIEAGHDQASVCMVSMVRSIVDAPYRHELVTSAAIEHVALLLDSGQTGAYPGARAMVFRGVWRDDRDELRKQVEKVVARSRWHSSRVAR